MKETYILRIRATGGKWFFVRAYKSLARLMRQANIEAGFHPDCEYFVTIEKRYSTGPLAETPLQFRILIGSWLQDAPGTPPVALTEAYDEECPF